MNKWFEQCLRDYRFLRLQCEMSETMTPVERREELDAISAGLREIQRNGGTSRPMTPSEVRIVKRNYGLADCSRQEFRTYPVNVWIK